MKSTRRIASLLVGIALLLPLLGLAAFLVQQYVSFDIYCTGRLKRAADANTVELAKEELTAATSYLESRKMTTGYTSVIYQTPDEDVGFWYKNLKASLEELQKVAPNATPLEKSNLLIKLRETILDHHGSESVTEPEGISRFPFNSVIIGLLISFFALFAIGIVMICSWWENSND